MWISIWGKLLWNRRKRFRSWGTVHFSLKWLFLSEDSFWGVEHLPFFISCYIIHIHFLGNFSVTASSKRGLKDNWIHSFAFAAETNVLLGNYTLSITCAIPLLSLHVHSFTLLVFSLKFKIPLSKKSKREGFNSYDLRGLSSCEVYFSWGFVHTKCFLFKCYQFSQLAGSRVHLKTCNFRVIIHGAIFPNLRRINLRNWCFSTDKIWSVLCLQGWYALKK